MTSIITTEYTDEGTDSLRPARLPINEAIKRISALTADSTTALGGLGGVPFSPDINYPNGSAGAALRGGVGALKDDWQGIRRDLMAGVPMVMRAYGDSLDVGYRAGTLPAETVSIPSPEQCANFVNSFLGATVLTALNRAISGTTLKQALAGSDGSGSTFKQKMATNTDRIVSLSFGPNDAWGDNAYDVTEYKSGLVLAIGYIRESGAVPFLITPVPTVTVGTFSKVGGVNSIARAQATALFAQAMREVGAALGVMVHDRFRYFEQLLRMDGILPLNVFPDSLHCSDVAGAFPGYTFEGNNRAEVFLGPIAARLSSPGQRIPASNASVRATGQTISESFTSREGVVVTTGVGVGQKLRMVFKVEETGLDISMLHPIWNAGATQISANLDGVPIGNFPLPMYDGGFTSVFWQDYENEIARNIPPGFHLLILTTATSGAAGIHGLRARAAARPLLLPKAGVSPVSERQLIAQEIELSSASPEAFFLLDDAPASRFLRPCQYRFDGKLSKGGLGSGLIFGSNTGSNAGPASAERALTVGIDGAGHPFVMECDGPGHYASPYVFSTATDYSLASHSYRVVLSSAMPGTCSLFIDGAQVGITVNLSRNYSGGLVGVWKSDASATLTINNLTRVWNQE